MITGTILTRCVLPPLNLPEAFSIEVLRYLPSMEAITLVLLGLLFWPSHPRPTPVALTGERVRITSGASGWATGVVRESRGDSLMVGLAAGDTPVALADAARMRVQVSRGRATRTRRGMRIGFVAGAVIGTGVGLLLESEVCDYSCPFGGRGEGAALLGVSAALAGLGIGALIGTASHHERWADLRPVRPTVSLITPVGRAGLGLRWSLPPMER